MKYIPLLITCLCVRPPVMLRWWPWMSFWTGVTAATWTLAKWAGRRFCTSPWNHVWCVLLLCVCWVSYVCVCVWWGLLWSFTSSQTFPGSCTAAGTSALEAVVLFWMFPVQIYLRLEAPFRFKRHLNVLFCCVCLSPLTFDLITLILCVQCVSGHRADEAVEMLKRFYQQENPNGTRNFSHYPF